MILKLGSKGVEVEKLQNFLGLPINGNFDESVEKAIKKWQKKNDLYDDGIVGPNTLKKMGILLESDVPTKESPLRIERLKGHIPDSIINQISDTASKFGITSTLRLAHFLSQCGHESGGFKVFSENLNYSADGLKKIFGKYFPGNLNESYARNPEKIANRVYSSRMGNGDETSGDGYRFRGRGAIQLSGKSNYEAFDKFVEDDIIANPDLVATKYPLMSAAFFFNKNGLWKICDKGSSDSVVTELTKRINGGTLGIDDRIEKFKEYYSLLK
jgi:putative chitinase